MNVTLRFYAELNDLLPRRRRQQSAVCAFELPRSVKDLIEAQGVPHTEIDLIVVNGRPVGFDHPVGDGDRVAVYPRFTSRDVAPAMTLLPEPLAVPRFVLDVHLGRLATYLRLLGLDALYSNHGDDPNLARNSQTEERILLTRDRGLLMRSIVARGYWVRAIDSRRQVVEVVRRYDLVPSFAPLSRCLRCNTPLHPIAKKAIIDRLPPRTRLYYDEFAICDTCDRLYWKGSHYERMLAFADWVRQTASQGDSPGET